MHVITGIIRKAPYTKDGEGQKGAWKMYAVELSESWKDFKTQERKYTNYRATMFASSPGAIQYYDEVLVEGSIVSISCDQLQINQREHNGKVYVTLEPVQPRLIFANADMAQLKKMADEKSSGGNSKPSQPAPRNNQQAPQQSNNEPPMDFNEDIPFASIGLQYSSHAIHSI